MSALPAMTANDRLVQRFGALSRMLTAFADSRWRKQCELWPVQAVMGFTAPGWTVTAREPGRVTVTKLDGQTIILDAPVPFQ